MHGDNLVEAALIEVVEIPENQPVAGLVDVFHRQFQGHKWGEAWYAAIVDELFRLSITNLTRRVGQGQAQVEAIGLCVVPDEAVQGNRFIIEGRVAL